MLRNAAILLALTSALTLSVPSLAAAGQPTPKPVVAKRATPKPVTPKRAEVTPGLRVKTLPNVKPPTAEPSTYVPAKAASAADDFPDSWVRMVFFIRGYHFVMDAEGQGGNGARVQLYDYNQSAAQIWVREPAAEGGGFLHPLYNRWLCLGARGTTAGAEFEVQDCNGSQQQRWRLYGSAPSLTIRPDYDRNLCGDVQYSNYNYNTTIWLWGCHGGGSQEWRRGYCWDSECGGLDPGWTGCNVGARSVADTTYAAGRLQVRLSDTCKSIWGWLNFSSSNSWDKDLEFRQFPEGAGYYEYFRTVARPGETVASPMFATIYTWKYQSCIIDSLSGGTNLGCTPQV
ncbi:RICIN domain-containing protein [Flindersiella endophytica]